LSQEASESLQIKAKWPKPAAWFSLLAQVATEPRSFKSFFKLRSL